MNLCKLYDATTVFVCFSSHSVTSDVSLVETAHAAEFFLTDGVILTGTATGRPASPKELKDLKVNCNVPVLIGSGITLENIEQYREADACIIGSYFKEDGKWQNHLDSKRLKQFLKVVKEI